MAVMIELPIRSTLMMMAAVLSSLRVLSMRARSSIAGSTGLPSTPRTSGITATPVSKPDRPSASFGNTMNAKATIMIGLPRCPYSS